MQIKPSLLAWGANGVRRLHSKLKKGSRLIWASRDFEQCWQAIEGII